MNDALKLRHKDPKGPNSVLFRGQLTGIHPHSIGDTRKAHIYIHNFLPSKDEKEHFDMLHKQYILDVKNKSKRKGRGSIVVKFSPNLNENGINAGRDYSVIHEVPCYE